MTRFLTLCLILWMGFIGLFWVGCQSAEKHRAQNLFTMNLGTEPPTLDPAQADDLVSITVLSNLMRGLVQYDAKGNISPAMAQRWTISPDGKHYTFWIRPNATWADGKPLTAYDFERSWRRVLNPETGSPYAFLLFPIEGAKALYDGKRKPDSPWGVHVKNNRVLEITLNEPVAYFLPILAFTTTLPVRQDVIATHPQNWTEAGNFISNGPYTLARWAHESDIMLKPNPRYWAGAPQNNGVQMLMIPEPNTSLMMYENKELDFVETTSSLPSKEVRRLKTRPDFHALTLHGMRYVGMNTEKGPLKDPRVRQALALATDKTYFPQLFKSGETPSNGWITQGLTGFDPNAGLAFDLKQAQDKLAQAGYPQGKGCPVIDLYYASTTPENRQVAEILQYQWRKHLGVSVAIHNVEWKMYLKLLHDDPPALFLLQWYIDYRDPDSWMNVFITGSGNNYTRWQDTRYDKLVARASHEIHPEKRAHLYHEAQDRLLKKSPAIIPLYRMPKAYLLNPRVKGFRLDALNIVLLDDLKLRR